MYITPSEIEWFYFEDQQLWKKTDRYLEETNIKRISQKQVKLKIILKNYTTNTIFRSRARAHPWPQTQNKISHCNNS